MIVNPGVAYRLRMGRPALGSLPFPPRMTHFYLPLFLLGLPPANDVLAEN
jgi:hypothetical protein